MRRDTAQAQYAYQQVTAEFGREQSAAANKTGTSYVLADLNEYERRCNTIPKSFEEYGVRFLWPLKLTWNFSSRVRIAFAASGFIQILLLFVIGNLNKDDMEFVFARATQLRCVIVLSKNLYIHMFS